VARFLFAWELGEGLGHVTSLRPLALELTRRGHTVVIAVRDVRSAAVAYADSGITFVQCPYQTWKTSPRFARLQTYAHMLSSIAFGDPNALAALILAWRNLYRLASPDLIVFDHSPTALLAARSLGVPRVLMGLGFYDPPLASPLPALLTVGPDGAPAGPAPDRASMQDDEALVLSTVNAALSLCQTPPMARLADLFDVELHLLTTYEELDHFGPRKEARYWGVHSSIPAAPPEWPDGPGRRIFAYLKPTPDLQNLLMQLRATDQPTLVFGSWVNEAARQRVETARLKLSAKPLDLTLTGQECDLAILNGTHGTTATMLLAGTPVLQLPIFTEQAMIASRTAAIGAGIMVNQHDTAAVASALADMLQSDRFAAAAAAFAAKYADQDPQATFAGMTEQVIALLR